MKKEWKKMGIPEILINEDFDTFETKEKWQKEVRYTCKAFSIHHPRPMGFLIMIGGTGTGKDHLSTAIAKTFDKFGYTTQSRLLRVIRESYKNGNTEKVIRRIERVPLLVLSEMGVVFGGGDMEVILYDIMSYRYENKLPTILNSNLDAKGVKEILGERIVSRIQEAIFATLKFYGKDYRKGRRENYFNESDDVETN